MALFMATQSVMLHLPDIIYERVQRTAQLLHQPVEKLLLDALTTALPLLDDLPPEMVDDMAALALLNDAALWRVARNTLAPASQSHLDDLLGKKGEGTLTPAEQQRLDQLLKEYEQIVLIRAQAALLLKQRGYDLSNTQIKCSLYASSPAPLGHGGMAPSNRLMSSL